jgi:tetratricopeptide (TPR) repeat protein
MSVKEDPYNDRNAFYFGRELFFYGQNDRAAKELKRHLALPTARWAPERAASMRFIAKASPDEAEEYLLKAVNEAPGRREALVDLAKLYYKRSQWVNSRKYALDALAIKEKPLEYLCEAEAWGAAPHDYASIACYRLGLYDEALVHAQNAVDIDPVDPRLQANLEFCKEAVAKTLA